MPHFKQRGMVLISALLLLVVVTLLALSMFRSFGIQEKIAGNLREKHRSLQAAESAQQFAEFWLSSGNGSTGVICNGPLNANSGQGQVCSNTLASVVPGGDITIPWPLTVGVTYTPPSMIVDPSLAATGSYFATPRFYITYLGPAPVGQKGDVYQIDAMAYGGSVTAVSVVESTYLVTSGVKNLGGQ